MAPPYLRSVSLRGELHGVLLACLRVVVEYREEKLLHLQRHEYHRRDERPVLVQCVVVLFYGQAERLARFQLIPHLLVERVTTWGGLLADSGWPALSDVMPQVRYQSRETCGDGQERRAEFCYHCSNHIGLSLVSHRQHFRQYCMDGKKIRLLSFAF